MYICIKWVTDYLKFLLHMCYLLVDSWWSGAGGSAADQHVSARADPAPPDGHSCVLDAKQYGTTSGIDEW